MFQEIPKLMQPSSSVNNGASTSTAVVPKPMGIANEDDTQTSVKDVSEIMDIKICWIDAMQDHWCAADKCFKKVWPQLHTYRTEELHTVKHNTMIDRTFTRYIDVDIMLYFSYFSYNRTVLNKIIIEYWSK